MKHLKLTKSSEKELRGWHAGSGTAFFSHGDGKTLKIVDIQFLSGSEGIYLSIGNSRNIKLTPEQEDIIGDYALTDCE
jgi:hypothetical protein